MISFHNTIMGRTFFEGHIPRLIRALEKIGKNLEKEDQEAELINALENERKRRLELEGRIDNMIEYFEGVEDLNEESRLYAPYVIRALRDVRYPPKK